MKKIKNFYKGHPVFMILMAIFIVCVVLIVTVLFQCFYSGNGDKYGDRLEGIESYKIENSKLKDIEGNTTANEIVKTTKVFITGKIIYIEIEFNEETDLESAKSVAATTLALFSEEEQGFYDFNITLKKAASENSDKFLVSGAHNKSGHGLSWNNNREVEVKDEE